MVWRIVVAWLFVYVYVFKYFKIKFEKYWKLNKHKLLQIEHDGNIFIIIYLQCILCDIEIYTYNLCVVCNGMLLCNILLKLI